MSDWFKQSCQPEWAFYLKHCVGMRLSENGFGAIATTLLLVIIVILVIMSIADWIKK